MRLLSDFTSRVKTHPIYHGVLAVLGLLTLIFVIMILKQQLQIQDTVQLTV